ncbi:endonuclease/exonuclease/phosphatase family protein [Luteimonas sp. e5]
MARRRLKLLSANIQAGSSTRRYSDYATRSWSHVIPLGGKRMALDAIAELARQHDIVGLQEADPGSLRSGFTNQTHYLANRAGFAYWTHQPNRSVGGVAGSANGLLSQMEPLEVETHPLPGRVKGRGLLVGRFGKGEDGLAVAVAHLSLGVQSRLSQLAFIAEILGDARNAVLMGDFNCGVEQPEMDVLFRRTRLQPPDCDVPTFPAWAPERAIDHILATSEISSEKHCALPAAASDHLALSVELEVPESALQR